MTTAGGAGAEHPGVFGERPAVIGHRGLGCGVVAGHQQNSLSSFAAAVDSGARWVEADVRRLRDDVLVVAHDAAYPDRTRLEDVTGAEADRRGTLRLGTLLDELPPQVGLNLDLKSSMDDCLRSPGQTTAGLLAPVVAAEATRRPLMVSSFDPAALSLLRAAAPRVPLGLLTWYQFPVEMAVAACVHMDVEVLALHVGSLRDGTAGGEIDSGVLARLLALLHRCGRQLLVWCPQIALARFLVSAGTDAVVVDDLPEALVALSPSPQLGGRTTTTLTSGRNRPDVGAGPSRGPVRGEGLGAPVDRQNSRCHRIAVGDPDVLCGRATQGALGGNGQADARYSGG